MSDLTVILLRITIMLMWGFFCYVVGLCTGYGRATKHHNQILKTPQ